MKTSQSLYAICMGLFLSINCSSLFAACATTPTYITPSAQSLQGAASAVTNGGMLSSEWHEGTIQINCTNMPTSQESNGFGTLMLDFLTTGKTIQFEGLTYGVIRTSIPDVFMIASLHPPKALPYPIKESSREFPTDRPEPNGNVNLTFRIRIRYVAQSKLSPGIRTFSQASIFSKQPLLQFWNIGCVPGVPGCVTKSNVGDVYVKPFSFTANSISCKLSSSAQVQLAKISMYSLPAVGSTNKAAVFQMGVSCQKSYAPYKIHYEMTDVTTPSNFTENLTLANTPGQASGVQLRIIDNGTPLKFGPRPSSTSGPGLFGEMPALGGTLTKTLTAQYIRTADTLTPGKVNAGVTVTLSYE